MVYSLLEAIDVLSPRACCTAPSLSKITSPGAVNVVAEDVLGMELHH